MPARKPIKVQRPKPLHVFPLRQQPLFAVADRYAATILTETVTDLGPNDLTNEAHCTLMRLSRHYTSDCESIAHDQAGDAMNASFDAGLMLGLAFGLRLRGAA